MENFIATPLNGDGETISLSYSDVGTGQPVILIHGWPSSKEMWEYQVNALVHAGFRVISYDRRGFGKSSKPWNGYHYDHFADDLSTLMESLDVKQAILVGFSMGGGEVARYLSKYGTARVSKAVLISTVLPYLLKTDGHPNGVPSNVFDEMITSIEDDRNNFLEGFGQGFFGQENSSKPLSAPYLTYFRSLAEVASPRATTECVKAFSETDFRDDLPHFTIPTLIIHGDEDSIVPIDLSSNLTAKLIPSSTYKIYKGGAHGIFRTEKDQLNRDLIAFFREKSGG